MLYFGCMIMFPITLWHVWDTLKTQISSGEVDYAAWNFVLYVNLNERRCNNSVIRAARTMEYFPVPIRRKYLLQEYSKTGIIKIRTKYLTFPIPPKAK